MSDIETNLDVIPEPVQPETVKVSVNIPVQLARDAKALAALRDLGLSEYYSSAINAYNSQILRIITAEQKASLVRHPHPFLSK